MKKILFIVLLFLITANSYSKEKYIVTASILPQKYFINQIAGDKAKVNVMVLPGNSPATYEPKPNQLKNLSKSVIYFSIGVPFEKVWLNKILSANHKMKLVNTQENIELKPITRSHTHSKGETLDPHIWLSPRLVKIQAKNILDALIDFDSSNKNYYQKNYDNFINEIDKLDNNIKQQLKNLKTRKFMVFHPSWGYFADNYDLIQIPVEVEGKSPSMKELSNLIQKALKEKIKVIFVQPQFSQKSANIIAKQIGGKVVPIDPLSENWAKNLLKVAKTFQVYLGR